jgi:hypothetical protein
MGVDYIGQRPRSEAGWDFHLNWTGHEFMGRLLEQLGAELAEFDGSNDGVRIRAATCRDWAGRLRAGLAAGRLSILRVADSQCQGGLGEVPEVAGGAPGPLCGLFDAISGMYADPDAVSPPEAGTVRALNPDDVAWIGEFATFLEECGGCLQC